MVPPGRTLLFCKAKEARLTKERLPGFLLPGEGRLLGSCSLLANLALPAWQEKQSGLHINALLNAPILQDKHQPITVVQL